MSSNIVVDKTIYVNAAAGAVLNYAKKDAIKLAINQWQVVELTFGAATYIYDPEHLVEQYIV